MLFRRMATLMGAGLNVYDALKVCRKSPFVEDVILNLESGNPLSDCLFKTHAFSQFEINIIQAGENSNNLKDSFDGLVEYFEFRRDSVQKLVQAFSYPVLVFLTSILTVFFMMHFIIPSFQEVFEKSAAEIPLITRFVLQASYQIEWTIRSPAFWMGSLGLLVIFWIYRKQIGKKILDFFILIPFLKERVYGLNSLFFFGNFAIQLRSGIYFLDALSQCRSILFVPELRRGCKRTEDLIEGGESIERAFLKWGVFTAQELALIQAGEEANQLSDAFLQISQSKKIQIQNDSQLLGKLLEPIILLVIGLIVGVILIAMYLPMFQLNSIF